MSAQKISKQRAEKLAQIALVNRDRGMCMTEEQWDIELLPPAQRSAYWAEYARRIHRETAIMCGRLPPDHTADERAKP